MLNQIPFKRYQPLIEQWQQFQETIFQPLPTTIWTNTLRLNPDKLAQLFQQESIPAEPLPWYPGAFQLAPEFKPGHHWAFLAGLYHVQEAVAMLPALFLNPQPHERILDMCAAPGNKTAQMAVMMDGKGTVLANDIDHGRMRATRQTLERLGLTNVSTVSGDGANYPKKSGPFDKIMVDVPCTCEGTSRKKPKVVQRVTPSLCLKKSGLQRALLRKAVLLCKPGGRIVYATCTYSPEENEFVVNAILEEFGPDVLKIAQMYMDNFTSSPGLTTWRDHRLHPSLHHAMRIWPHQNDTGGFFIAVIDKQGQANGAEVERSHAAQPQRVGLDGSQAVDLTISILAERFGLSDSHFTNGVLFEPYKGGVYLVNQDHWPAPRPKPDAMGMLLMKTSIKYPKLTTSGAIAFGNHATRNYLELDPAQTQAYLNRQPFTVSEAQRQSCTGPGYVIVRFNGISLGVGLYRWNGLDETEGQVESMFPKGWSPNKGK